MPECKLKELVTFFPLYAVLLLQPKYSHRLFKKEKREREGKGREREGKGREGKKDIKMLISLQEILASVI